MKRVRCGFIGGKLDDEDERWKIRVSMRRKGGFRVSAIESFWG
jgi:hypothetical protein